MPRRDGAKKFAQSTNRRKYRQAGVAKKRPDPTSKEQKPK